MTQRVAILGSTGQLGTDLVDVLRRDDQFEVIALTHQDADCTKADEVRGVILKLRPQAVINCAAYVRVDECEERAEEAFHVNAVGALNVARACAKVDALCLYISTDYVFDGEKQTPYAESDTPNPINVYGTSKLAGEYLTRQAASRWLIARLSSLFGKVGARGKGGNFVETVLAKAKAGESLRIVDDIRMSPTYAYDAARTLAQLMRKDAAGIVHLTNEGCCSWYEFARAALAETSLAAEVEPVDSKNYPTKATRPKNSTLISGRLERLGIAPLPPWRSALRAYLLEKSHVAD